MAIKTWASGEVLTASDLNTYAGNPGLVYIASFDISAQGTAAAPFQCTNIFSSTYDNYRIIASLYGSAFSFCTLQYLVGTTPDNGAAYVRRGWYQAGTTLGAYSGSGETSHFFCQYGNSASYGYTIADVFNPYKAMRTGINVRNVDTYASDVYDISGSQTNTTSQFTGFQLAATSGNMTGTVTVYGYRKP